MRLIQRVLLSLLAAVALPASATFHLWAMTELYSNADGTVQFLELRALTGAQEFIAGHSIRATSGGTTHTFTVTQNLPGDSSGRTFLIGTQGFAALGVVTPDVTVPNGFFFAGGGSIDWGEGSDVWSHGAVPTNGNDSLNRDGSTSTNSPRNFAGQTGTVRQPASQPAPAVSLSGDQIDFGSINVGARSNTGTITLVSSGNAAYRVTALTNTPGNCSGPPMCTGSDFACTTTCATGADIAPGASCNITATFSPTAAGPRTTTINLCDNVGGGRSTSLVLKGTGATATTEALNIEGLWWASPANSESGWGVNLTQQGDIVFATWFTYDTDGSGLWLVMSNGARQAGTNTYAGALFRTTGPAFSAATFNPASVVVTPVGNATFTFTDANTGTFSYTVNGVSQTKAIVRQVYASPVPACTLGGTQPSTPNFQDLWWRSPANSESGWGVNVTHQGDILFVTWFTYDANGKGMWLVGSSVSRTTGNTFSGQLFQTRGPAFSASPWNPSQVTVTPVGTVTLTFSDASNGTFAYTVNGVSQTKPITRQVFSTPATVCR